MDDLAELKAFLSDHKDEEKVQALLSEFVPKPELTAEMVKPFLETEEGKRLVDPIADARVARGIETFKTKTMPGEIEKAVAAKLKELNPEETPEQKLLREQNERIAKLEKERDEERLRSSLMSYASEKKLPATVFEFLKFETEEIGRAFIDQLKSYEETIRREAANKALASGTSEPGSGNDGANDKGKPMSTEQMVSQILAGHEDVVDQQLANLSK